LSALGEARRLRLRSEEDKYENEYQEHQARTFHEDLMEFWFLAVDENG
jgi:hypothetical protein